jgi:hypothetical protein
MLHDIYIGMFKHLKIWIECFVQRHGKSAVFDEIWAGIRSYPIVYHCCKAYGQILPWRGQEMRNFGGIIYSALAVGLDDPLPIHEGVIQRASTRVWLPVY